jgi:prepilin-type N-terminal cleavage/methylation domain-containing protein
MNMNRHKGFSLIELMIVVVVIAIIASVAISNMIRSKVAANEASAVSSIRSISTAQITYAATNGSGTYSPDLATLMGANLIDNAVGSGSKDGYNFVTAGVGNTFTANASPVNPGITGDKGFFVDQTGVIRFNPGGVAGAADPPVGN